MTASSFGFLFEDEDFSRDWHADGFAKAAAWVCQMGWLPKDLDSKVQRILASPQAHDPAAIKERLEEAFGRGEPKRGEALLLALEFVCEHAGHFKVDPEGLLEEFKQVVTSPAKGEPLSCGHVLKGRYVLLEWVGTGGMGEVWAAVDAALARKVALKVSLAKGSKEDIAGFLQSLEKEASRQSRLSHSKIARLFDHGHEGGRAFICMEFIEGVTLSKYWTKQRHSKDAHRRMVDHLVKACEAVSYAHAHGVVHGDIKPANIMLGESITVMDLGRGQTAEFMAPERIDTLHGDVACDVYSLGASLYWMLTGSDHLGNRDGEKPVVENQDDEKRDIEKLAKRLKTLTPKRPRELDRTIHPDLEAIVLKCMEKDPVRRYRSVDELKQDLQRRNQGKMVDARERTLRYRTASWVSAHWTVVGATSVAALVILCLLGRWVFVELRAKAREVAINTLAVRHTRRSVIKEWIREPERTPSSIRTAWEDELKKLDELATRYDSMPQLHYERSQAYLELGDYEKAKVDAEQSVALEPGFTPGWALLALIRMRAIRHKGYQELFVAVQSSSGRKRDSSPKSADHEAGELQGTSESGAMLRYLRNIERDLEKGWKEVDARIHLERTAIESWGLSVTDEDEALLDIVNALRTRYVKADLPRARQRLIESNAARPSQAYCEWLVRFSETPEEKLKWMDQALRIAPHDFLNRFERGLLLQEHHRSLEAVSDYTAVLDFDPSLTAARNNLGNALREARDLDKAIDAFSLALKASPRNSVIWCNRGVAFHDQKKHLDALNDFNKAIELDPHNLFAHIDRGNVLSDLGKVDGALASYQKAIDLDPNHAGVYANRGAVRRANNDLKGAREDYDKAIALDPASAQGYYNRARLHSLEGRTEESRQDYEEALKRNPKHAWALNNLAYYWVKKAMDLPPGDARLKEAMAKALELYDRAVQADPGDPSLWNDRGAACKEAGQYEQAVASFLEALKLDPKEGKHRANLGETRRLLGERLLQSAPIEALALWDQALKDCREAISDGPAHHLGHLNLANTHFARGDLHNERGRPKEALLEWQKALLAYDAAFILAPGDSFIKHNRGLLRRTLAKATGVTEDSPKSETTAAVDATSFYQRALVRRSKGDNQGAVKDLESALEFSDTKAAVFREHLERLLGELRK